MLKKNLGLKIDWVASKCETAKCQNIWLLPVRTDTVGGCAIKSEILVVMKMEMEWTVHGTAASVAGQTPD
jgi:hypothetical protein